MTLSGLAGWAVAYWGPHSLLTAVESAALAAGLTLLGSRFVRRRELEDLVSHHPALGGSRGRMSGRVTTVAIPVLQGAAELDRLLPVIRGQALDGPIEMIIVADSESTDGSADVARRHGAAVIPVRRAEFCTAALGTC